MSRLDGADSRAPIVIAALLAALCLALAAPLGAVAAKKSPMDEPDAYVIGFKKEANGAKRAYVDGMATPQGVYLKIKGLWSTQPVKLLVLPDDKGRNMRVELFKYHWKPPLRSCSTAEKGQCGFAFTNQGDVLIKITAPDGPAKVYVAAEIGPEATPKMKSVLVPKGVRQ